MQIQAPKGTQDVLPVDSWKWQAVESIACQVAKIYHYDEIRTPVFEFTELFHRGVGETSDVVHKETYTFEDRGGRSITLRPEGTAGVVRAAIEHGLIAQEGSRSKVFYLSSNFRYENTQLGRLRQHHQFGVEAFGVAAPQQDVECILLQMDFYRRCGIKDLALRINSLGDRDSKKAYAQKLAEFLTPRAAALSEDSQRRLTENPLRILDSKDPRDVAASQNAPRAADSLSPKSAAHLDKVKSLLTQANAPFTLDGTLVRGFDYYTETLWEVTASGLGAQNALGGGGRYDNLVENLGGRSTPGVGFGSGLERLLLALDAQNSPLPKPQNNLLWLIPMGDAASAQILPLLQKLRAANVPVDTDYSGRSMKAQLKIANRENAAYLVILGDNELASQTIQWHDMTTGQKTPIPLSSLIDHARNATSPPIVQP